MAESSSKSFVYRIAVLILAASLLAGCATPENIAAITGVKSARAEISKLVELKAPRGMVEVRVGANWLPLPAGGNRFPWMSSF